MYNNNVREVFSLKQKYVPLEKQSKRERREYYSAQRGNWGGISPVTKKPPNPKAYNRKKSGQRRELLDRVFSWRGEIITLI